MSMEASAMKYDNGETNPYLEVSGLEFSYGEVKVLHGLEFQLAPQSIGCVMGRNGVGKTTFLRNLVGLESSSAGKIYIEGKNATNLEAHERACNGIGYVPQGKQIFPLLTVEENLLVALEAAENSDGSIPASVYETFPVLDQMRKRRGGDLSGATATTRHWSGLGNPSKISCSR